MTGENRKYNFKVGDKIGSVELLEDLGFIYKPTKRYRKWLVRCFCGNEKEMLQRNIIKSTANNCACGRLLPEGLSNAKFIYYGYQKTAEVRGLEFKITFDEFFKISQMNCHYCGSPPSNTRNPIHASGPRKGTPRGNGAFVYGGIDRVVNEIGYERLNCVPSCITCNMAKMARSSEAFIGWIKRVYLHSVVPTTKTTED